MEQDKKIDIMNTELNKDSSFHQLKKEDREFSDIIMHYKIRLRDKEKDLKKK